MCEQIDVLLAEDNANEIELACIALRKRNITGVHIVRDGAEALDFLFCTGDYVERNPDQLPKVVVLDINMPKVNGLTVLEHIRSHERTEHLPVIIMTNSVNQTDMETAHRWNVNTYVQKPLNFQEFVATFGNVLADWL